MRRLPPSPDTAPPAKPWPLLIATALLIWTVAYLQVNLDWFTPMPHQAERASRRLLTCAGGVAICLAMTPLLFRAAMMPMLKRLAVIVLVSAAAFLAHFALRLSAFHLVAPLWGPVDHAVVWGGLKGSGWMFPLWSVACVAIAWEITSRRRSTAPEVSSEPLGEAAHGSDCIWLKSGRRKLKVRLSEVSMFEAEGDYVRVITDDKRTLIRGRLKDVESALPTTGFLRVHRSIIVRLEAVEAVEPNGSVWRLRLRGGQVAAVSRPYWPVVRSRLQGLTPRASPQMTFAR